MLDHQVVGVVQHLYMAEQAPQDTTPQKRLPRVQSLHAKEWKSLDFGCGGVGSTVGSSPNQKVRQKY